MKTTQETHDWKKCGLLDVMRTSHVKDTQSDSFFRNSRNGRILEELGEETRKRSSATVRPVRFEASSKAQRRWSWEMNIELGVTSVTQRDERQLLATTTCKLGRRARL